MTCCNNQCNQGRDCPERKSIDPTTIIKWLIGILALALFPFVIVIAAVYCIVYAIPVTVGTWIYDLKRFL